MVLLVREPRARMVIVRIRLRVQKSFVRFVEVGDQLMSHGYSPQQLVNMYGLWCADHADDLSVYSIHGVAGTVQRMQWWSWAGLWLCRLLLCMWRPWTRR